MVLGHLMTCSGLTHPEVSLLASPGSSFWSVIVYYPGWPVTRHSVYMLCPISSVVLYFVQNWDYISFLCNLYVCFIICPSVCCCICDIFHLCCCYSSCVSCCNGPVVTTVHSAGRASVLYSFIPVFFKVFCALNILLIMPVICK